VFHIDHLAQWCVHHEERLISMFLFLDQFALVCCVGFVNWISKPQLSDQSHAWNCDFTLSRTFCALKFTGNVGEDNTACA
jgi:hypothetical protein